MPLEVCMFFGLHPKGLRFSTIFGSEEHVGTHCFTERHQQTQSQTLNVRCICMHLIPKLPKCRSIHLTLSVWDRNAFDPRKTSTNTTHVSKKEVKRPHPNLYPCSGRNMLQRFRHLSYTCTLGPVI